jgi:8-amino-7-oxononanoate synthase
MPSSWNLPALNRANRRRARDENESILSAMTEGRPMRREGDNWLERWLETCADLARLKTSHPMLDAVIEEIDGRNIRVGDKWLVDFASCNYLGFDLDPEIMGSIDEYVRAWGTHPSWSRLLGSPVLYEQIEADLSELLDAEDTLALPTITLIHMAIVPVLAGAGTIYLDGRAHKTLYDGCQTAKAHGAAIKRFQHNDADHLAELLQQPSSTPRLICMDGVNSMTGNTPDVRDFARLAREHEALLYIDDAHGFGVIGERSPDETSPYGMRGNGVVRHYGETYDDIVFVSGLSKSYSSLLAFVSCSRKLKDGLKVVAPPYLYSGPSPVASLATTLMGLKVNAERGDEIRADLFRKTKRVLDQVGSLGIATPNNSVFPIIEIPLANPEDIDDVGRYLFDRGVYVTLAAYPLVPRNEVGFRVQLTAANTDEQIDLLNDVLAELCDRFSIHATPEQHAVNG